ncbi:MAG: hypothetical protein EPO02_11485 [Nitrospirae bacterium]|nr:MAG: hypothetical protein EPO02_11485 [Nitrospirota bacterium]
MQPKSASALLIAGVALLVMTAYSLAPAQPVLPKPMSCKDFPVAIYPSHTSASCETSAGPPLNHTAYIESADSVEKVTAYYKTQVQSAGWTVDPMEVESPTRALVSMKKGKGYANAVINAKMGGTGSRIQIHAYPNGN